MSLVPPPIGTNHQCDVNLVFVPMPCVRMLATSLHGAKCLPPLWKNPGWPETHVELVLLIPNVSKLGALVVLKRPTSAAHLRLIVSSALCTSRICCTLVKPCCKRQCVRKSIRLSYSKWIVRSVGRWHCALMVSQLRSLSVRTARKLGWSKGQPALIL